MKEAFARADYEYRRAEKYKKVLINNNIKLPKIDSLDFVLKEWGIKRNNKNE